MPQQKSHCTPKTHSENPVCQRGSGGSQRSVRNRKTWAPVPRIIQTHSNCIRSTIRTRNATHVTQRRATLLQYSPGNCYHGIGLFEYRVRFPNGVNPRRAHNIELAKDLFGLVGATCPITCPDDYFVSFSIQELSTCSYVDIAWWLRTSRWYEEHAAAVVSLASLRQT